MQQGGNRVHLAKAYQLEGNERYYRKAQAKCMSVEERKDISWCIAAT